MANTPDEEALAQQLAELAAKEIEKMGALPDQAALDKIITGIIEENEK